MTKIHIILTGGTIDSFFDPAKATTIVSQKTAITDYLADKIKLYPEIEFEMLCMLDSRAMTDNIRKEIVQAVEKSKHTKILITHGTDTMPETARYLSQHMGKTDKTIILTGAMIPLKEFAMSDAGFNMGYAIAQAEHASAGIYIAMNANLFKAEGVVKNKTIGRFEHRA